MKLNEELWANHQYQVLVSFIHHLAYYRTLKQYYDVSPIESEFWVRTIDTHLLRSVIDWCMVFGADSSEVHWKNVVVGEKARSSFRSRLLAVTGMAEGQWRDYWSDMTTFRNNFAAQKTVATNYPSVPIMDMALLVATAYDDWLRSSIDAIFDEPSLRARYDRLVRVSGHSFLKLISSGPTVEEEYEGNPPSKT